MEICRSEVQSLADQENEKIILFFIFIILYMYLFCLIFGEQQIF